MLRGYLMQRTAAVRRGAGAVERLESRTLLSSTLVPVQGVRDLVFDPGRDLLYATAGSTVQRYNSATGQLLAPLEAGVALNGLDLTPDGSAIYAAGGNVGQSTLVRFDLPGGTLTSRRFGTSSESGYDVAIDSTGRGLVTTRPQFAFSQFPVREFMAGSLDLANRPDPAGGVNSPAVLARSADRSATLLEDFWGTFRLFDAASNAFSPKANGVVTGSPVPVAVGRDGSLFAVRQSLDTLVFDRGFATVRSLTGIGGGGGFDARGDVFYGVDQATDQLVAYDTLTWREKYRLAIGEDVGVSGAFEAPAAGTTAFSDDGTKLFLVTGSGVRVIELPQSTGRADHFELTASTRLLQTGATVSLTLTARDSAGELATGYRGAVTVTSSDPAAIVPGTYLFTDADQGSKTFDVTMNTPGTHSLVATDDTTGALTARVEGVVVHAANEPVGLVPVANARDLVFDPVRGLLYVTTTDGTVERYDPFRGRLLDAIRVGGPLNGADTTPDGAFLYAADASHGLLQGYVRKINLSDGSVTRIAYDAAPTPSDTGDPAGWDVAVLNNGKALLTAAGYPGGPGAPLRTLSLADDTVTVRTEPVVYQAINRLPTQTAVARGADRSAAAVLGTTTGGPAISYDAAADLLAWVNYDSGMLGGIPGLNQPAVSRDGALFAFQDGYRATVVTKELERVRFHEGINAGIVFDPVRDTLYGVNAALDAVIAYDTRNGVERYRVPVGQDVPADNFESMGPGNMAVNADGTQLFLITLQGVRVIDLLHPTRQAASFEFTGLPSVVKAGLARTFTVTARDNVGDVAADCRGTVHFSSTDAAAGLPSDYTFTAADQGVKTFTVTFSSAGSQTVTATDTVSPAAAGTSGPVSVHTGSAPLIPIAGASDVVVDAARGLLYVTTLSGTVERFDLATQSLLPPVKVGKQLSGADITPDGAYLYAADLVRSATQAFVHKIRLSDGSTSSVAFPATYPARGTFDVAIGADGSVVFSSPFGPMRELDPGAASPVPVPGEAPVSMFGAAQPGLARGADRRLMFFGGAFGPAGIYNPTTNAFEPPPYPYDLQFYSGPLPVAVSRDSRLFAGWVNYSSAGPEARPEVWDHDLRHVHVLPGIDGGMVFDPHRAVLYGVDSASNELVVYDTVGWSEKYRLPIGEDVSRAQLMGPGQAAVSDDGSMFFLTTPAGVRVIELPRPRGDAGSFVVNDFPRVIRAGVPGQFTVRAYDGQGNFFPGYRGTVRFSASDVAAGLPSEYTFTAVDAGVHTFTATFNTVGTRRLVVRDTSDATAMGSEDGIAVHAGDPGLLPIPSRRDLVYDPVRNMLYVTTDAGAVERYDLATQTLLPPLDVGRPMRGADVTEDGDYLYATTWFTGRHGDGSSSEPGIIAKVRLSDGAVTPLTYPLQGIESDGWDLSIAGDGRAFFSGSFLGSGSAPIRAIDLATDAISVVGGAYASPIFNAEVSRGPDRSAVFITTIGVSPGNAISRYGAADHQFAYAPGITPGVVTSVSRDGRYAVAPGYSTTVMGQNFETVATLPALAGAVFDPSRDVLYGVTAFNGPDMLVAYDASTWAPIIGTPLGFDVADYSYTPFDGGVMSASGDGKWLFINVPGGVRVVPVPAQNLGVVGRHAFYNHSAFDGNDVAATAADDDAIATDKQPLRPGQPATFVNVTGYSRGINGVMVDVFNYIGYAGAFAVGPNGPFSIKVGTGGDPATWADAPVPSDVTYRRGAGVGGSDRVTFTWPDGAIKNEWLQVTVKASPFMSIPAPDVFYFGNLVGETGEGDTAFRVNALDSGRVKQQLNRSANVMSGVDLNRDGRVNALDLGIVKATLNHSLPTLNRPLPALVTSESITLPPTLFATKPVGVLEEHVADWL